MKKLTQRIFGTAALCIVVVFVSFSSGVGGDGKKLFIVHSYEKDDICGQPQHDGAIKALSDAGWRQGENLEVATYYMDTKKNNNTPELIAEQANLAVEEIAAFQPDVVITLDDNAFRAVALPASGTSTSYIFSGMNNQPENYDRQKEFMADRATPGGNITGVYEKLYIREAIRVLSSLHEMNSVLFLGDMSPTGKAIKKQVELELNEESNIPVPAVELRMMNSWEEFTTTLAQFNDSAEFGALYLGALLLKDKNGRVYTAPEIINHILLHAHKPTIGLNYAFIKLGLFGGATVDFFSMGELAGEKAAAVLSGVEPGSLPIEDAPRVALVFNLKRAEQLGLKIPADILLAADEVFNK
jgi:ABC-type uncharacterized transport system substrate-binding protein